MKTDPKRMWAILICLAIMTVAITLFASIKTNLNKSVEDLTVSDVYSDMYIEETT